MIQQRALLNEPCFTCIARHRPFAPERACEGYHICTFLGSPSSAFTTRERGLEDEGPTVYPVSIYRPGLCMNDHSSLLGKAYISASSKSTSDGLDDPRNASQEDVTSVVQSESPRNFEVGRIFSEHNKSRPS